MNIAALATLLGPISLNKTALGETVVERINSHLPAEYRCAPDVSGDALRSLLAALPESQAELLKMVTLIDHDEARELAMDVEDAAREYAQSERCFGLVALVLAVASMMVSLSLFVVFLVDSMLAGHSPDTAWLVDFFKALIQLAMQLFGLS